MPLRPELFTRPVSLRRLVLRSHAEALALADELDQIAGELEQLQIGLVRNRLSTGRVDATLQARCEDLERQHDHLATELARARMAIAGAAEDLGLRGDAALAG